MVLQIIVEVILKSIKFNKLNKKWTAIFLPPL